MQGGGGIGIFQHHALWRRRVRPVVVASQSLWGRWSLTRVRKRWNVVSSPACSRSRKVLEPHLTFRHRVLPPRVPLHVSPGSPHVEYFLVDAGRAMQEADQERRLAYKTAICGICSALPHHKVHNH